MAKKEIPGVEDYKGAAAGWGALKAVAEALMQVHGQGKIEYVPFPDDLKDRYQHYTQAAIAGLRAAGYTAGFTPIGDGVKQTFAEGPVS